MSADRRSRGARGRVANERRGLERRTASAHSTDRQSLTFAPLALFHSTTIANPIAATHGMGTSINVLIKSWALAGCATFTPAAGRWNWT